MKPHEHILTLNCIFTDKLKFKFKHTQTLLNRPFVTMGFLNTAFLFSLNGTSWQFPTNNVFLPQEDAVKLLTLKSIAVKRLSFLIPRETFTTVSGVKTCRHEQSSLVCWRKREVRKVFAGFHVFMFHVFMSLLSLRCFLM